MSYWVKTLLGLALFLAGLAAFEYSLYEIMQIGTCASGGPYVSARPCPEGTAEKALLMPAGFILGTIGLIVYAFRGRRPGAGDDARGISAPLLGWCSIFVVTGVVALLAGYGPGADPDQPARWVGIFLAALFIPMGLAAVWVARLGRSTRRTVAPLLAAQRDAVRPSPAARPPTPVPPRPPTPSGGDAVDRLRKLGELRDSGVLSAAEFDAAKARILADL
jgi:hypothetical protein